LADPFALLGTGKAQRAFAIGAHVRNGGVAVAGATARATSVRETTVPNWFAAQRTKAHTLPGASRLPAVEDRPGRTGFDDQPIALADNAARTARDLGDDIRSEPTEPKRQATETRPHLRVSNRGPGSAAAQLFHLLEGARPVFAHQAR
jgi:hypothetical protein